MPNLDLPVQGYDDPIVGNNDYALPVAQPIPQNIPRVYVDSPGIENRQEQQPILKPVDYNPFEKLLGINGAERYKTWPEKLITSGITAAGDALSGKIPQYEVDPVSGDVHTSPQMLERALDMASMAGTGGLAGTTDATLGSAPFLRPALKYKDKLYKGKEGQQHMDVIPEALYPEFQKMAMSGEDISHYNFGFHNDKGQFLSREKALEYGINTGLIDPQAGKFGALTSTLMADSSKPGVAIEAVAKAEPFFSALEHNVNQIKQSKMTGDQWLGTLSNKPGVKPEELDWTGLKSFLEENKGKAVTKGQIEEHLANNKVELKEVEKTQPKNIIKGNGWDEVDGVASTDTKYHSYQLPGGGNYREMLLTLPKKSDADFIKAYEKETGLNLKEVLGHDPKPEEIANLRRNMGATEVAGLDYKSSHWDEPNILAHVRMNDRTIDGKKSLHLEEIQSDWHQQGRDKGYVEKYKPEDLKMASTAEMTDPQRFWYVKTPDNVFQISKVKAPTFEDAKQYILNEKSINSGGVPDAPFKKSWHELALKRMIREAAEKGYDRLSWTPGEAQAARYDLSKTVDSLQYNPTTHKLLGHKDRRLLIDQKVPPEKLPDFIGKEAADKIMNNPSIKNESLNDKGTFNHYLENADLKIGGEGMKGFYDKIIPSALEKLGKEHGVKVKQGEILPKGGYHLEGNRIVNDNGGYIDNPDVVAQFKKDSHKIHYIDIPKSLRDTAMHKGFPLFSSGIPIPLMPIDHDPWKFKPVDGNPFEEDKKK